MLERGARFSNDLVRLNSNKFRFNSTYSYIKEALTVPSNQSGNATREASAVKYRRSAISILSMMLMVGGCTNPRVRAPVVDAAPIPSYRIQRHVVAPGETLYSIAWRYDMDYQDLSKINGLGEGNRIRPGQVLALSGTPPTPAVSAPQPSGPGPGPPRNTVVRAPDTAPAPAPEQAPERAPRARRRRRASRRPRHSIPAPISTSPARWRTFRAAI